MITKADMVKQHREPIPPMEGGAGALKRNSKKDSEFDFDSLAENHLVNELLGLNRQHRQKGANSNDESRTTLMPDAKSSRISHIHGGGGGGRERPYTGLHPKLYEKLDYVINEGVLDSVLSFICPVPVPVAQTLAATSRAKPKQSISPAVPRSTTETSYLQAPVPTSTPTSSPTALPGAAQMPGPPTSQVDQTVFSMSSEANSVVRAMVKEQSNKSLPPSSTTTTMRRKSLLLVKDSKHARQERKEPDVVIHVCDEVKNTSRDFTCPQSLLVSKMGYFADVTAGQRLDEMDISVHCDIQIFDWLMKWIKHSAQSHELSAPPSQSASSSSGPQLDGNNVVPILVSASFLQMEPLLLECLAFCHAHLSEVVRTSTNLSCLNDALVTRLAAMFTNLELEMVRDKKERVTPRLWTKLIQSLCEPDPEALRGHFYSISGLFRCARCFNCVTNTMKSYVNCLVNHIRLNRWGQLVSHHVRDTSWDLNIYILQQFKELKSWRKVYWKLWGHCHYLYCCICEMHFPVYQMNWCRYHPEPPNYLGPVAEGRIAGPAGRYACCGQQAFRFETLPGPNGCQFREHSVLVETDRERAILAIAQLVAENYAMCEMPPLRTQELAASGEPNWMDISLTPQRCRQGLLPQLCMDVTNHRVSRVRAFHNSRHKIDTSSDSDTTSTSEDDVRFLRSKARNAMQQAADDEDVSSSSDGCESEHRPPPKKSRGKKIRKRPAEVSGRYWSGELSARSNQDHQRDFEEKIMKQVVSYVTKKTGSDQSLIQNSQPIGGTYVRLEAEWKEMLKQRHNNHNISNSGGFSSNQVTYSGLGTTGVCGSNLLSSGASMLVKQKHK
ncbi:uncharacterized protein KIAA1841 homolog isoform X2 [Scaptodrosophila lebanonensis]|uniref:Uncharacterized protein KIAA1841 homolog isoform X2 n=1 Tax=Drosophila lebanonensis TaxID=7225 RepID=A0A6J2UF26_DROLE|nr:uncharacterized protein KIAA1841 homolog isoform X2 [Scaptodrosophila lebanonensis]